MSAHDHAGGGQHEVVADRGAEHALGPERRQEPDPRHRGREHERQLHQRDRHGAPAERAGGEQPRRGRPDHDHDRQRRRRAQQAQPQRLERALLPQAGDQLARRRVEEDRQHRERQERQHRAQREHQHPDEGMPHRGGGGSKPAASSALWPSPSSRPSTKRLRVLGVLRPLHHRDTVGDGRLQRVGQLDRLQTPAGAAHVGDVDEARVDGALGELADDARHVGLLGADVAQDRRRLALGQPARTRPACSCRSARTPTRSPA